MKPMKAFVSLCLLGSQTLLADNVEERAWPVTSLLIPNPFQVNPAAIPTDRTIIGGLRLDRREESRYLINPDGNAPARIQHATNKRDVALGFQLPLGGAAFGLSGDEHSRQITGKSDQRNGEVFEEFWVRDYKMKFVVDLLPQLRGAFTFRYQSHEADLLGGYGVGNDDRTRYKGTMSGYSLGVNYKVGNALNIGVFTAPPLRGKATIEGEQKIITDPGLGGLELGFKYSDRLSLGLSVLKWSYKHDDRDEDTTSPVNQRNIFLRGVEVEQYFRKTLAIGIGAEFAILPMVGVKGSITKQEGVFLFDPTLVPGDNKDVETKLVSNELRLGGFIRNNQFFVELVLMKSSKSKDRVRVRRNGITALGDYEHDDSSNVLVLGAAF
ncbi:hypothetical protein [Oligoflexus tunisiensis]|uniref:hypothetical protein n=1 Tax=Oligoflexus tunisiensis TaxID=708132 RepID=UPI00114CA45F|nr:hypothetical protein [Oligoflexus tunisiensis]